MPNLVSRMLVREMTRDIEGATGLVIVSFGGLNVGETEDLRGKLADQGAGFRMIRNKLARIVLAERGIELEGDALAGNTAIAFGTPEQVIGAAKVLSDPELKKKVRFKAGLLEGQVLDAVSTAALADVPDRTTLNAQLLGVICGPPRALATVVAAVPAGAARVLQGRADQLAEAAG